jgi:sugar fermentation stimulation protein A
MRIEGDIKEAVFLTRLTRFSALVSLEDKEEVVYLPNTGRIWQLLRPGTRVYVRKRDIPGRQTKWDLPFFSLGTTLVWADPRAANAVIFEALTEGLLSQFRSFPFTYKEATFNGARFDFLLQNERQKYLLEVKSVALVKEGTALFPDAPAKRGARQLETLLQARKGGYQGGIIFVVQREDAHAFSPHKQLDARFCEVLERCIHAGIDIYAYKCKVTVGEIVLGEMIGILL